MPVYQADARYLHAAIESVCAQTITNWEMVIVEEPPAGCVAEMVAGFADPRIRHVTRGERTRLCDTLNEGLMHCRASLVARLDADDVMEPGRLAAQADHLEANEAVAVLGSAVTVIDEEDRVIGSRTMPLSAEDVADALRRYNALTHPAVMFRREAVLSAGGYRPVRAEDYDLWCRLAVRGDRLENLPQRLLRYRYHRRSVKFGTVREMLRETIATKTRHFHGRFTARDRLRLAAERLLLLAPPRLVLWLFRRIEY